MRELFLSNCEKSFVQKIVSQGHRLDGRAFNQCRKLSINFGSEYGSCIVSLGETRVLAQVSCEVVQPKQIRPNEGVLFINVEIGPMAAPQFEANRQTDLMVYLNRILEKLFKDSKCVDLESLCIVVEEKVWSLRVDIKVLNHAGNIVECASIAALSALAHFKRPDVTRSGDEVIIHTVTEKDPIPTVLYHYPVCLMFAVFGHDTLISDPSFLEEAVCMSTAEDGISTGGGLLVVGMNQYRELCVLNLAGAAMYKPNLLHRATRDAATRSKEIVDTIKDAICKDDSSRRKRVKINFSDVITDDHVSSLIRKDLSICLKNFHMKGDTMEVDSEGEGDREVAMAGDVEEEPSKYNVIPTTTKTAETATKTGSTWIEISSDSEED